MNKKIIIIIIGFVFLGTSILVAKTMYSRYSGKYHFYRGDIISILKERIDLSDEQTAKLNTLLESSKVKREEFRENFSGKRKELVELFFKEGVTREEINLKIDKLAPEIIDFVKYISGIVLDVKSVLTKEQVKELRESYKKRSCRFGKE